MDVSHCLEIMFEPHFPPMLDMAEMARYCSMCVDKMNPATMVTRPL